MNPVPATDQSLAEQDVRKMVRLLGEVISTPGDFMEKKVQLMNGLCGIIDADAWVWGVGQHNPENAPFYVAFAKGGFDDERFGRLMEAVNHPEMENFARPFSEELNVSGSHLTRLRQQINRDGTFSGSDAERAWLRANIDGVILSCKPLSDGGFSSIGIYRNADKPLFAERECRIAHIVLSEVPWLHLEGWPSERGESAKTLYPRLRTVLNLLIESWSRKQIAQHLGLRENTVHGYVKEIYQHFQVHSHAELMKRFSSGNGGDLPLTPPAEKIPKS
ncbi:MAG: LuxR family transcriptional regulator [Akkermansiaceae bacterium]|jgi:DNA-binding CsgD family transcriptional regulator|nr:LuxR family transcriptional regulator [Akkermansiaceae bacterium]